MRSSTAAAAGEEEKKRTSAEETSVCVETSAATRTSETSEDGGEHGSPPSADRQSGLAATGPQGGKAFKDLAVRWRSSQSKHTVFEGESGGGSGPKPPPPPPPMRKISEEQNTSTRWKRSLTQKTEEGEGVEAEEELLPMLTAGTYIRLAEDVKRGGNKSAVNKTGTKKERKKSIHL